MIHAPCSKTDPATITPVGKTKKPQGHQTQFLRGITPLHSHVLARLATMCYHIQNGDFSCVLIVGCKRFQQLEQAIAEMGGLLTFFVLVRPSKSKESWQLNRVYTQTLKFHAT